MIVIVSHDSDFSAALAEQVERELKFSCHLAKTPEEVAKLPGKIDAVITLTPGKFPVPTLHVKTAPVKMRQLLSDIRALAPSPDAEVTLLGECEFSPRQKQLTHKTSGKSVSLTDKEAQLIKILAAAGKGSIAKDALLRDVWGIEQEMDTHTLETHIYRLRAKLRELGDSPAITAVENGYRLER